jgi:PAS domain-containing protein
MKGRSKTSNSFTPSGPNLASDGASICTAPSCSASISSLSLYSVAVGVDLDLDLAAWSARRRFLAKNSAALPLGVSMADHVAELDDDRARASAAFCSTTPVSPTCKILDADGLPLRRDPGVGGAVVGEDLRAEPVRQAFRLSRSTGLPTFQRQPGERRRMAFCPVVPHFRDGRHVGSLVAMYSFRKLLADQVPWWFAQKYRLSVVDANGLILGSKSNIEAGEETLRHRIPFDPPGHGLVLVATAYQAETNLPRNLLALAIVALGAGVVASLWAQRRHMQKRLDAEQALSKEYAFRKAMEDSLFTGLRARDLEGRIIYVNPAFCRMTGFDAEELVNRCPPMPYWAPEEHEATQAAHRNRWPARRPTRASSCACSARTASASTPSSTKRR